MPSSSAPVVCDVIVVGGGIVGMSAALALQARGQQVVVIDPGLPQGRASYGNAGVISPGSIFPMAGPGIWPGLLRYILNRDPALRIRYRDFWALLPWGMRFLQAANVSAWNHASMALNPLVAGAADSHRALAADLGVSQWLRHNGWLRLYRSVASFDATVHERRLLKQHQVDAQVLEADQIYELEPCLQRRFERAVFFPQAISIEQPGRLLDRAYQVFRERGGDATEMTVTRLEQKGDTVVAMTPAGRIQARHAVLAAGAWSGHLAHQLGYRIPLIAERGYHVHRFLSRGIRLNRPVNDVAGGYVIAPESDGVRILSGVELARPQSQSDYRQMRLVLSDAVHTLSLEPSGQDCETERVSESVSSEIWMGSRPSTPDGLPVLGRARLHDRIVFAFGHGHIGLSTGPTTGRIVADLITGQPLPFSLTPYDAMRFQR